MREKGVRLQAHCGHWNRKRGFPVNSGILALGHHHSPPVPNPWRTGHHTSPPPSLPHPCSLWRRDLAFCPRLAHWRCVRACHSSARCRHERHDTVTNTDYTPARSPSVSSGSTEKSGISIAGTNRKPPAAYLVRVYIYCHSILPACRWLGVLIEPLAAPLNLLVQLPIAVAIDSWTSNFSVPALIHIWYNHQWISWIINRAVHIHTQGVFVVTEHQLYTNIKRARLSLTTLKYFCKNLETKVFFSIWNHHECLSWLFPRHLNTYVLGLRSLEIFQFFQCGDRLYTSESDVYRRQILTYKDGPRTERVK